MFCARVFFVQTVADLFAAVKEGRPVNAKVKKPGKPKKKDSDDDKSKKPEKTQGKLALKTREPEMVLEEDFVLDDGQRIKGSLLRCAFSSCLLVCATYACIA